MPSTADAFSQLAEYLGKTGVLRGQPFSGSTDRRGEEQFAARRRPQPAGRSFQAALVGDLEVADLLDRVAEELDPERMFLDGREDIKNAAANSDVAAILHQVGTRVTSFHEPGEHVVEVGFLTGPQSDRLDVAEASHDGLQQAPYWGDDHLERAGRRITWVRVRQPAEHGEPLPDGVRTWREPFVRQRLPGREAYDRLRRKQRGQGRGQILCLAGGGRDRKHERRRAAIRAGAAGECGGHERPQGRRRDKVPTRLAGTRSGPARGALVFEAAAKLGVFGDDAEKSGKAHGLL